MKEEQKENVSNKQTGIDTVLPGKLWGVDEENLRNQIEILQKRPPVVLIIDDVIIDLARTKLPDENVEKLIQSVLDYLSQAEPSEVNKVSDK